MRQEIKDLMERFPVRKSRAQKAGFRDWLTSVLTGAGYEPRVDAGKGLLKSNNVIVGDPEGAKVVFTAHYDTPARMFWPNMLAPKSFLLTIVLQLPILVVMLGVTFGVSYGVERLTDEYLASLWAGYGVLLVLLWLMLAGPANPSNVNDNTSGTVTILLIALSMPAELRDKVAFVWFDNEEKGLMGSGKLKKQHGKGMKETLLVNFDCVSDGDHLCLFPTKGLKKRSELMDLLEETFPSAGEKTVELVRGTGYYPSDQKNFPLGVGVAAFHSSKFGPWLGRIHTARDTVFMEENIHLLCESSLALARRMGEP